MELEEFIKTTLISIAKGLRKVNQELAEIDRKRIGRDFSPYFVIEPNQREREQGYISFDIAVIVGHETNKSGRTGAKILVASLSGTKDTKDVYAKTSRIKFHVIPYVRIG
jgi:hypothetical protein